MYKQDNPNGRGFEVSLPSENERIPFDLSGMEALLLTLFASSEYYRKALHEKKSFLFHSRSLWSQHPSPKVDPGTSGNPIQGEQGTAELKLDCHAVT